MRLIAIHIARLGPNDDKPLFLSAAHDLSSFSFIQRSAVKDVSVFLARTILPRVSTGGREVIAHEGYLVYAIRWSDGLGLLAVADNEYPARVAFLCLGKVAEDFRKCVESKLWQSATRDHEIPYKERLREFLKQYSDPSKFDAVTVAQQKVEHTKQIMARNLDQVLGNQEAIEDLLTKSEDVSQQTKELFKTSKKMKKQCCVLM